MSMRTPLGKVRGLGAAKNGTHHWWMQRVTAIALVPLTLWFAASLVALVGEDHMTVITWMRQPLAAALLLAFIVVGFYHLQLGLQVVIEDYVTTEGRKVVTQMLATFTCSFVGLLAVLSLLQIFFGN